MDTYDPTDLRSREAQAAEIEERRRLAEHQWQSDLKWLMSDKRGRRVMAAMLDRAGMRQSSFDQNGLAMSFKEGIRWLGIWIESELKEHCLERYFELLKEDKQ